MSGKHRKSLISLPLVAAFVLTAASAQGLTTAAGYKPKFHIYSHGGHGWGMHKQGTTSDPWIDEFYYWLEAQRLTRPLK
jgi:hypothetical protein